MQVYADIAFTNSPVVFKAIAFSVLGPKMLNQLLEIFVGQITCI